LLPLSGRLLRQYLLGAPAPHPGPVGGTVMDSYFSPSDPASMHSSTAAGSAAATPPTREDRHAAEVIED
jgi:hypothetical protein